MSIPKRFIRVWVGNKEMPDIFQEWWQDFQNLHPTYEFITMSDCSLVKPSEQISKIIEDVKTCSGLSDILRLLALYQLGGVYVDTDVMPLKKFDDLLLEDTPFLAKRSNKSFEAAVMGSPKGHPAFKEALERFPEWYYSHQNRSAAVQTGPGFFSAVLFGRDDVRHLSSKTFYPYNGFMSPSRIDKMKLFSDKNNFPPEMYAAHFSNRRWGGKPK